MTPNEDKLLSFRAGEESFICDGPRDDTDRKCRNPEPRRLTEGYRCRECEQYFCGPCADDHFGHNPLRQAAKSAERCYELQKDAYQNAMANAERLHSELELMKGRMGAEKQEAPDALFTSYCPKHKRLGRDQTGFRCICAEIELAWIDGLGVGLRRAPVASPVEGKLREALRVFKRYGTHRGSCVQMSGKTCSCGFDDAATKAGALALPPCAPPDAPMSEEVSEAIAQADKGYNNGHVKGCGCDIEYWGCGEKIAQTLAAEVRRLRGIIK